jgi:hypothetical protein
MLDLGGHNVDGIQPTHIPSVEMQECFLAFVDQTIMGVYAVLQVVSEFFERDRLVFPSFLFEISSGVSLRLFVVSTKVLEEFSIMRRKPFLNYKLEGEFGHIPSLIFFRWLLLGGV